jgi:hypothetical protein
MLLHTPTLKTRVGNLGGYQYMRRFVQTLAKTGGFTTIVICMSRLVLVLT